MSHRREMNEVVKALKQEGAIVTITASGHYKVRHPETMRSVNISSSPRNPRSVLADVARLRKIGLLTTWKRGTARTTRRESDLAR